MISSSVQETSGKANMCQSYLAISVSLVLGLLVVKVLEVLVKGSLLCLRVLEQNCSYAAGLGGSLAVHGLVEGSIALLVLLLQLNLAHGDVLNGCNAAYGLFSVKRGD